MKRARILRAALSLFVLCAILVNLTACFTKVKAENLMDGIEPRAVSAKDDLTASNALVTDFAIRLFKASEQDGANTLISPLSVLCALAMTANGASENTLAEMESVLGMSADELNLYLYTYMNSLPEASKYKLSMANSIWFKDAEDFSVKSDFLQTNADFYGADIYKTPFDKQTIKDMNNWVKKNTDGMIPKVVDEIPRAALMYLINALAFEAEWESIYKDTQVRDAVFTTESGEGQSVELMYSNESKYLEGDGATGFIKYYNGRKYAFAALLPNDGISVSDYVASLDGEELNAMLIGAESTLVQCAIPKFKTEYSTELSAVLRSMGMVDAFDPENADFSALGTLANPDENIFISNVIHKTYIEVGEKGTKAGAVTSVQMSKNDAGMREEKQVILDRPFVYMLIDCENNIPFFIGTVMSVEG